MRQFTLKFDPGHRLESRAIKRFKGVVGLYFIYNTEISIRYPKRCSRLIYIGMSERPTNSVGSRLQSHSEGKSGNDGIRNYAIANGLMFTVMNYEMVRPFWKSPIEALEGYFLSDFVNKFGVYPICNNKMIYDPPANETGVATIDWDFFAR